MKTKIMILATLANIAAMSYNLYLLDRVKSIGAEVEQRTAGRSSPPPTDRSTHVQIDGRGNITFGCMWISIGPAKQNNKDLIWEGEIVNNDKNRIVTFDMTPDIMDEYLNRFVCFENAGQYALRPGERTTFRIVGPVPLMQNKPILYVKIKIEKPDGPSEYWRIDKPVTIDN